MTATRQTLISFCFALFSSRFDRKLFYIAGQLSLQTDGRERRLCAALQLIVRQHRMFARLTFVSTERR